ncbi:13980_t:CDS:2, partial [Dentiscutata heterogama]
CATIKIFCQRFQHDKHALDENICIEKGNRIPHELRYEAAKLQKDLNFDEAQTEPSSHIDDEYARAGIHDPKVLITTSRDPSSRLAQFAKEIRLIIPNSQRINRGNYVIKDMVDACRANEVTDLIILHEHRGEPDGMVICHFPYGPTAYFSLHNVVLRHDIQDEGTVSQGRRNNPCQMKSRQTLLELRYLQT